MKITRNVRELLLHCSRVLFIDLQDCQIKSGSSKMLLQILSMLPDFGNKFANFSISQTSLVDLWIWQGVFALLFLKVQLFLPCRRRKNLCVVWVTIQDGKYSFSNIQHYCKLFKWHIENWKWDFLFEMSW